ncbi:MAG: OmpA family protein, partial [Bacteroidota bacterium]
PMVNGVVGVRYRISRRLELEIEHRMAFSNDDLLDGQRYEETGTLTRDFDTYHHTTIGLHLRLGKGEESLWWTNPMASIYSDVKDSKDIVKRFTDDMDNDGIPDLYDKEPDTPEGMPVDVQGRTLDSDRDGFPDNIDAEPFTPRDCDVDSKGLALDSDSDGVPDCYDKEPGSNPGALVDAKGITINLSDVPTQVSGDGMGNPCVLPIVYFDLNKDVIKPDFYPELYYIAQLMKSNSSLKIQAIGYADNRADPDYNMGLSQRRVENAVNFIIETYGIDPGRFDIQYKGEDEAQIPGLPDNYNQTLEALHLANRRVEFECVN